MTEDQVRVLRVLEYEGPRSWVETTLANNAVKGTKRFSKSGKSYVIREAMIGEMPEILVRGVQDGAVEKSRDLYLTATEAAALASKRAYHFRGCPARRMPGQQPHLCDCDDQMALRKAS